MSTVIGVTSEDMLLPVLAQHAPSAIVLPAPAQQPLEQALTETWAALEAVGYLVVVLPAWLPADHRIRLHSLRSLLESDRMALVEVDLPPLAMALLTHQLRQIAQYDLGPGVIASAARLLAHYLYAGAVLGSVARLDRMRVGLTSHLKSWVPGARFAALATPEARLEQLTDGLRLPGPNYATHLAFGSPGGHPFGDEWVRGRLGQDWNCQYVCEVPLPAQSARWWGTGRLAEFAAYIADVGVLYQLVSSAHREPCHWCGLELVGDRCAFCEAGPAPGGDQGNTRTG
ncbi:hypothetical protein [Streptantibioticus ferralitis]|uniref:Uncharacterized protein n=1 Tax=Streptantibioticus ferralitis TaxID=236510 RepID=A0ABT5ZC04_9ACTN|nr:hypothetical protein [Streptantibioticus ferralitis]MDF2261374.1 hypothetical protein [Streptantibioticus ferralitis]